MRMESTGATRRRIESEDALARRVKVERERRGWSQETLARRVEDVLGGGFPQSAVSRIEKGRGRRSITVEELLALSDVFGIPFDELLLPADVAADRELYRLLDAAADAHWRVKVAQDAEAMAVQQILNHFLEHPELREAWERHQDDTPGGPIYGEEWLHEAIRAAMPVEVAQEAAPPRRKTKATKREVVEVEVALDALGSASRVTVLEAVATSKGWTK